MKKILSIFLAIIIAYWLFSGNKVILSDGIKIPFAPKQSKLPRDTEQFDLEGFIIKPIQVMDVSAKVLSKKYYSWDDFSDIIPLDLALGWENMSDEAILKDFDIKQSGRWYYWKMNRPVMKLRKVERQSSNWHIIPADDAIKDTLDDVKEGDIVQMKGYLVNVMSSSGEKKKTSLSRDDTGGGACEIMYVDEIIIRTPEFL